MSAWFSIRLSPRAGSLTAATAALAHAHVAVEIANAVNRAYSGQVVKVAAKRYGWAVKATGGNNLVLSKRK